VTGNPQSLSKTAVEQTARRLNYVGARDFRQVDAEESAAGETVQ